MSNLPPGCTDSDIDRAAGTDRKEECAECGWLFLVCELDEDGRCEACAEAHEKEGKE
jgi:hypothetical protein